MRIYKDIQTIVELTEEQNDRLKNLVKLAQTKGKKWNERETLEFLTMIRCPEFWDIQLNMYEKLIQKI